MTISSATASASYTGNGATAIFPVPFYFLTDGDLKVTRKTAAGVVTTLTLNSDYSVSDAGSPQGGSITTIPALSLGDQIFIERNVSAVQETAYPENGYFPAASHEKALDRLTMLVQQILTVLGFKLSRAPLATAYDAGGYGLTHVADAVDGTDAPNLAQVQALVAGAASGIVPALIATYTALASTLGTIGASLVGFIQSGSGAVARTVLGKLRENVSVFDFGAKGDGTTDDTAAIQAAINGSTGTVSLGDGYTFKVSKLTGRTKLRLVGASTLDFSGNADYSNGDTTGPLFEISGSAGSVVLLTANAAAGAITLTVASTAGIAPGDLVEIATPNHDGGFIDSSTTVHNGEICKVASVDSSTQLTLADPIVDETGYTTANGAQIRKLNTVDDIYIGPGIKIIGKGRPPSGQGDSGLSIIYGRNVEVHATFERVDLVAVGFHCCYNFEASGCVVEHDPKGANTNVNYGIVVYNSAKHGRVFKNHLSNMRHGIVTSHLSSALGLNRWGVVRCLDVYDNTILNTWHAGIATHNDADRVRFRDNTLIGCSFGVNVRERNAEVSGNRMIRCDTPIYLSAHPRNVVIRDNHAMDYTGNAIYFDLDGVGDLTNVTMYANTFTRGVAGITMIIPAAISAHKQVVIKNNRFADVTGAGGSQAMIRIGGAAVNSLTIDGNDITNCTSTAGISVGAGGDRVQIVNNVISSVTGNSILTTGTFTLSYGKGNIYKNWSGSAVMTNSASIGTDNTVNASL